MARRVNLLTLLLTGVAVGGGMAATPAVAASSCAPGITQTTPGAGSQPSPAKPITSSPSPGAPCWVDQTPYPFGSDGNPVDPSTPRCAGGAQDDQLSCYLRITSFAFRGYNRGLAATTAANDAPGTPFGVWIFNGTRWFPDPTFPGQRTCQGDTILWAGKLDYWLVGTGGNVNWPSLCRFDGVNFEWQPISVPALTLARVTTTPPFTTPDPGGITSGSCFSWDNCWFFGTYGAVIHWNGTALSDASPDISQPWLAGEYTSASAQRGATLAPYSLAAMATEGRAVSSGPLPGTPDGSPTDLLGSTGGPFGALPFAPATQPLGSDANRTDLVAVDVAADGHAWSAGNPAGFRSRGPQIGKPGGRVISTTPEPAPLTPVSPAGGDPACAGPPSSRFQYVDAPHGADAFLWASISVFEGSGSVLAGGRMRPAAPGSFPNDDALPEPVVVQASCDGTTTTTRFRIVDPTVSPAPPVADQPPPPTPMAPADRQGATSTVVANAPNDAWAATTPGSLEDRVGTRHAQRPHLYRLTDDTAPAAAPADDNETRPIVLQVDPPPPPDPVPFIPGLAPLPRKPSTSHDIKTKPAIYNVKAKLVGYNLHLTFSVRRRVTVGVIARRGSKVVATTGLKHFKPGRGQLVLKLSARRYPTSIKFINDLPTAHVSVPKRTLHGVVFITATARPLKGRKIKSVRFEYSRRGSGLWTEIGTRKHAPYYGYFKAGPLKAGHYDLRVVVTDSKGVSGVSAIVHRVVKNPPKASSVLSGRR